MKLSELQNLLTKVQSIAGDVEVVLRSADSEAETVIQDLAVHLDATSGEASSSVVVTHGTAAPAPDPQPPAGGDGGSGDGSAQQ